MLTIREEPIKEAIMSPRNEYATSLKDTLRVEVEDIAVKCDSALQVRSKDIYDMLKTQYTFNTISNRTTTSFNNSIENNSHKECQSKA
jgi:hypothetical protein